MKHKFILGFAQDVYRIVSTKDDKQFITGLMKLNQDYVMSEKAYTDSDKKHEPEVLKDMHRKLEQMAAQLAQLKCNDAKANKRIKTDVNKKTKENTSLICDLNVIKFEDKKQEIALKKKQTELKNYEDLVWHVKRDEAAARAELHALQNNPHHRSGAGAASQPPT